MNAPLFDQLEAGCRKTGKELADHIVGHCPPPWAEDALQATMDNLLQGVAETLLKHGLPDPIIEHLQLAAFDGFDARMRSVVEASAQEGGRS